MSGVHRWTILHHLVARQRFFNMSDYSALKNKLLDAGSTKIKLFVMPLPMIVLCYMTLDLS